MSLVTLTHYLSRGKDEGSYRKLIALLMNGIAQHSVRANTLEYETFLSELQAIRVSAADDCNLEQLFVSVGATVQALDSYNSRTTRFIRWQAIEMQNMISMLAQTIINIGGGNERSSDALVAIKNELEQTAGIDDVQKLKLRLGECLKKVLDESVRQKDESAAVVLELQRNLKTAQDSTKLDSDLDGATALPKVAGAIAAFTEGLKSPGRKYIITMVIDRLQPINARFGNAVGDQMLMTLRKYIESCVIEKGDQLFRWKGPTLVALLERQQSIVHVREALKRLLDKKIENEYNMGGRSALIPLSVAWSVIALIPPITNVPVFIDRFVATQIPRDYC